MRSLLTLAILAGASVSLGIGVYLLRGWQLVDVRIVDEDELRASCGMGVCGDVEEII